MSVVVESVPVESTPEAAASAVAATEVAEREAGLSATYSPDDNKLRLHSVARLDRSTYARVRAAGFIWAPKQGFFVVPCWTPDRADLLLSLCGEIDDEDSSLVDRAVERAERFQDYSASRTGEAQAARRAVSAIADHIPLGQPILVGHHSERMARKNAERIENGMRRAVQLWDTAQYWKQRAAGALRHAKYKERADVRARRIKGIEADKRKHERNEAEAQAKLALWSVQNMTRDQALRAANVCHLSHCFTLAEYPRQAPASQYEGSMGLWSALDGGVATVEQVRAIALAAYPRLIAYARRWIEHLDNRLTYERAMLQEQGGLVADQQTIEVGGQVLVGGQWLTVLRLNKTGGRVVSVTTNGRYGKVKGLEEIKEYKAPSAELAAAVKAATKVPPLANYPGEGFVAMTREQWERVPKDYKGTQKVEATATAEAHRVRVAMGFYAQPEQRSDPNKRHAYPRVFLSDAKTVQPPAAVRQGAIQGEGGRTIATMAISTPVPVVSQPRPAVSAAPTEFDAMREQLRQGVQVVSAPQLFPTPPALAERMADLAGLADGVRVLEPSAGTGRLIDALQASGHSMHIVAVERSPALCEMLQVRQARRLCEGTQQAPQPAPHGVPQTVEVLCRDFLELSAGAGEPGCIGRFDVVLMNPPFENGVDIAHIVHAHGMLASGGRLVAICANGPRQNEKLRPLVEAAGGTWEALPADMFAEEGTTVRTVLLTLPAAEG